MTTNTRAALFALLALQACALAGPPLVCFPYLIGERPNLLPGITPESGAKEVIGALVDVLDQEEETLVRAEAIRRAVMAMGTDDDLGKLCSTLASRARRLEADVVREDSEQVRAMHRARFDHALAGETARYMGDESLSQLAALRESALALGHDAGCWLVVARAVSPLTRTGTLAEHARAFSLAHELALAHPEGASRDHLLATFAKDLDWTEAYTLDSQLKADGIEPTPDARMERLREVAAASLVADLRAGRSEAFRGLAGKPLLSGLGAAADAGLVASDAQSEDAVEALAFTATHIPALWQHCLDKLRAASLGKAPVLSEAPSVRTAARAAFDRLHASKR